MKNYDILLKDYSRKLHKAIKHLEYSYNKSKKLTTLVDGLTEEELEVWESFSSRFSRTVDIFLTKYIRTAILLKDPGFEGCLRDFVNNAEKFKIIENADQWMELRELRNISAHDYSESDLKIYFENIREKTPIILELKNKIK